MPKTGKNLKAWINMCLGKAPEFLDFISSNTDDEFLEFLDTILERTISQLESNSNNFDSLNEVAISGALAMGLSVPGLTVIQEGHSNGHVDLTITAENCSPIRKILAEAKIYNGPSNHIKGMKQLLDRYVTGRELRGIMLSYVKDKNIETKIKNTRNRLDEDKPLQQTKPCEDYSFKWSFASEHKISSGNKFFVVHVGCNMYTG